MVSSFVLHQLDIQLFAKYHFPLGFGLTPALPKALSIACFGVLFGLKLNCLELLCVRYKIIFGRVKENFYKKSWANPTFFYRTFILYRSLTKKNIPATRRIDATTISTTATVLSGSPMNTMFLIRMKPSGVTT